MSELTGSPLEETTMKRSLATAFALLAVQACGPGTSTNDRAVAADTLTRAQKDSIVADLPVPGAGGVGAAMRARDALNETTQRHDTIR